MANRHYLWSLPALFILLIQTPILANAQQPDYESTDISKVSPNNNLHSTLSTHLNNNHEEILYDGDNENGGGEIYDDEEDFDEKSPTTTISESQFKHNRTSDINEDIETSDYTDEGSPEEHNTDDDDEENHIYADTMSVNRPDSKHPITEPQSTVRIPSVSSNLWRDLFSRPTILVGIIGGIVIGMLSAILLVMFIIYRMRKKDEGSYALEEGPRKSPSHAYTRVSSREFFA